jgi:NTE family protein
LSEADLIVALSTGSPHPAWCARTASLLDCELVVIDAPVRDSLIDRLQPRLTRAVRGRQGLANAMRELGARAAERAVGVVLSGGGARAFSHVGVVEELRRSGIAIDRIAGVSLGSLVAASAARGDTADESYAHFRHYFVEQNPSNDYTLPLVALIRGRKTARLIEEVFGRTRIEELQIPFFCTSVDLMCREPVVHRTGPVAQAILASLSIPGVFPPVIDRHRRVLVDGGVIDNLPVRVMAEDGGGPVIAVDVSNIAGVPRTATRRGALASTSRVLRRWITGSGEALPPLPETIVRCMTLGSADTAALARQHADLVITPNVSGIGLLDWRRLPEMRTAGVAATQTALQQHPEFLDRIRAS